VKLRNVALAAAGVGAGYAIERLTIGRAHARATEADLGELRLPEDVVVRRIATDDGGDVYVVERGTGRPIVLLHGVMLSSVLWAHQLADLGDRHRVLALDHRGHGESRTGSEPWALSRLAADLASVLIELDLRDALLVGHSMGGMVALKLAVDRPALFHERIAGLALVSTSAGPVHRLAAWKTVVDAVTPRINKSLVGVAGRLPGGLFPANDLSYLLFRLGHGKNASPANIELNRRMAAATPVTVWTELMREILAFDLRDDLSRIGVPTMVVVGSRDLLTPPSHARELIERIHGAELYVIRDAGHLPMLEKGEQLSELLEQFATRLP